MLIVEPKRWNSGYHFVETPRVALQEAKLTAEDVFNHIHQSTNRHSHFNPIVLGLEDTVIFHSKVLILLTSKQIIQSLMNVSIC